MRKRGPNPKSTMQVMRFLIHGSFGYAKSWARNCVKALIGRKAYFTPEDVFFRIYGRQLLGIQPMDKITCAGFALEGPGSQALTVIKAITFCRAFGLTYVHTPFTHILHADRPMQEWVAAWERHFNLGLGEVAKEGDHSELVEFASNSTQLYRLFGEPDPEYLRDVTVPELRRKYYSNKSKRKNEVLVVWVQVRRGDVTSSRYPPMWTSASFIAETIAMVKEVLDARGLRYKICVFSQGTYDEIKELDTVGTEIFLNGDPIWSMQEAIEADILLMAKSTFSFVSALISDGIKIYEECWYPPMEDWVRRGANGKFDREAFERQLEQLIIVRAV